MAYIAPNSTIKLLSRVPICNDFNDSVWYSTPTAQFNDFSSYALHTLNEYTYQRHGRDYIRVTLPNITTSNPTPNNNVADALLDVNYMMFRNTNFGDKWFYAFVTDVEYVNNSCAELKYEIDPIQTFMFDYSLQPCYVEREHSATDNIGDNLVDEKINVGELVPYSRSKYRLTWSFDYCDFIILYIRDSALWTGATMDELAAQIAPVNGGNVFNKIYSACDYYTVTGRTDSASNIAQLRSDLNDMIRLITDAKNTIVSIIQVPKKMLVGGNFANVSDGSIDINTTSITPSYRSFEINRPTNFLYQNDHTFGNYAFTPHNNKLFIYPYNSFTISNRGGSVSTYKYEHFCYPNSMKVRLIYATTPVFDSCVVPEDYLTLANANVIGYDADYAIKGAGIPIPTYSLSSFDLWRAQNSSSMTVEALGGILKGAIAALAAAYTGGASAAVMAGAGIAGGVVGASTTIMTQAISATDAPDIYRGSGGDSALMAGANTLGFDVCRMQIKPSVAKQIDSYFDLYGYAVRSVKIPSLASSPRPYWHYTKTVGCNVHPKTSSGTSGIPIQYQNQINTIYDNGIRYWMNTLNNVDHYDLNNAPV